MSDEAQESPLPRLPPREPDSHKGTYGRVLLIGGSRGMSGAIALSGMAALRSGAGLVQLAVPKCCLATVAGFEPSYMTVPLADDGQGHIDVLAHSDVLDLVDAATVVAVGPGLGRSSSLDKLVSRLYRRVENPLVVDADGLNALAESPEVLERHAGPRILTPHPGEFARLTDTKEPKAHREALATQLANRCDVTIVLKGHRSFITDGKQSAHNTTGNPGMATGGTGDVLTGVIAGLLAQGLSPWDAARLGAHLHGLAGDLAAEELGQVSLIASDLIRWLPRAFLTQSPTQ